MSGPTGYSLGLSSGHKIVGRGVGGGVGCGVGGGVGGGVGKKKFSMNGAGVGEPPVLS